MRSCGTSASGPSSSIRGAFNDPIPDRPTLADVLAPRANFCNQTDSRGQVIYGPSLPAAIALGWAPEWFARDRAAGSTHWISGPPTPGKAYGEHFPGEFPNEPENPDLRDPAKLRAYILSILETPSANGRGYVPILFLDGGGKDPKPRIDQWWQAWGQALADLLPSCIVVPGWEVVRGDWSSADISYALTKIHDWFPGVTIGVHLSPGRGSFSSNPLEPDDPWHGDEAACYRSHGGEFVDVQFYETDHAPVLYEPITCQCARWPERYGHEKSNEQCQLNRVEDSVGRNGAGDKGWRRLKAVCLMETVALEYYSRNRLLEFPNDTSQDAIHIAQLAKVRVYDKWAVPFYGGNGLVP